MSTEIKSNTTGNPQKFGRYVVKSILGEGNGLSIWRKILFFSASYSKVIALEKTR